MDEPSLADCFLKLGRFKKHLEVLHGRISGFIEDKPYTLVSEEEPERVIRMRLTEQPSREFGLLIGDCVHNLRSCLDYLAWQLALLETEDPPITTEFPIFADRDRFESRERGGGRHKIRCLAADAQAVVERLQPYNGSKNPRADVLWKLHQLSRIDKHRFLPVGVMTLTYSAVSYTVAGRHLNTMAWWQGVTEDSAVVARIDDADPMPDADVDVEANLALDVAFAEGENLKGLRVIHTLASIGNFIDKELLPAFAGFFDEA